MCIVVLVAAWIIMFEIGLFVHEIVNGNSKKVEDTKKLCPASNRLLDCLDI